jgi:hypothetical protein
MSLSRYTLLLAFIPVPGGPQGLLGFEDLVADAWGERGNGQVGIQSEGGWCGGCLIWAPGVEGV